MEKNTFREKLEAVYALQTIHSKIDKLQSVRGELPMEVKDLEAEVEGIETRLKRITDEINELEDDIVNKKAAIKESQALIKKYEQQQNNVKNNREFEALASEIEVQTLEIQLCEKRIKEYQFDIKQKTELLSTTEALFAERKEDLKNKSSELDEIVKETEIEEKNLENQVPTAEKKIDERLLKAYHRLRKNHKNGLAVVAIDRDACGGCYSKIPPQRRSEIRDAKKVTICENCGRIIVDETFAGEIVA
jgi:uncharacterized protein